MKYRNRKTGEIVEIISFSPDTDRTKDDYVSYIDSNGVEHPRVKGLNIHWDFEIVGCNDDFSYIQWEYMIKSVSVFENKADFNLVELGNEGWELCSTIHYDKIFKTDFIFKRPKLPNAKCGTV